MMCASKSANFDSIVSMNPGSESATRSATNSIPCEFEITNTKSIFPLHPAGGPPLTSGIPMSIFSPSVVAPDVPLVLTSPPVPAPVVDPELPVASPEALDPALDPDEPSPPLTSPPPPDSPVSEPARGPHATSAAPSMSIRARIVATAYPSAPSRATRPRPWPLGRTCRAPRPAPGDLRSRSVEVAALLCPPTSPMHRNDAEPVNKSDNNIIRETWGFINIAHAPQFNNQSAFLFDRPPRKEAIIPALITIGRQTKCGAEVPSRTARIEQHPAVAIVAGRARRKPLSGNDRLVLPGADFLPQKLANTAEA